MLNIPTCSLLFVVSSKEAYHLFYRITIKSCMMTLIIVLYTIEVSHIFHCLYQSVCKLPGVSARAGMLTVYAPVHCMQKGGRK